MKLQLRHYAAGALVLWLAALACSFVLTFGAVSAHHALILAAVIGGWTLFVWAVQ